MYTAGGAHTSDFKHGLGALYQALSVTATQK